MPWEYTESLCPAGDEDWYKFSVAVGQEITVQLYDLPADYELELWSPANTLLAWGGQGGTTGEQIFHTATADGLYRARVRSALGDYSGLPYKLALIVPPLPTATPGATP